VLNSDRQLGRFAQTVDFIVCDGIFVLPLRLTGASSRAVGKTLIGGPEAVADDYVPQVRTLSCTPSWFLYERLGRYLGIM
jgi:hypothetical protein